MAFNRSITQRLMGLTRAAIPALTNCRISNPRSAFKSPVLNQSSPSQLASEPKDDGIFRRYLHRQSAAQPPEFRFLPTGEKLLERIRDIGFGKDRVRLDGLIPPPETEEEAPEVAEELSVMDAKKILKVSQLEMVKERLREVERETVSYTEFLEICSRDCSSFDQGLEFAKMLDQSGSVIVLQNNTVHLKPEKVVKAIQGLIQTRLPLNPSDPRMQELQELETQKAEIDRKAEVLVKRELWGGLGYLLIQTAAFMRLTFWELSWDVMEPICFYVTSIYFMGGYAFFLRTSKEPSFEGFYQSRFDVKQNRLMKAQNFDIERYNKLKKACYPHSTNQAAAAFSSPDALRTY